MATATTTGSFFVTGGTLRSDAPSYVERQADQDLLQSLLAGEFCYVLTSRQMGKSSLMVRTATKLRERGVHVVALDLTAIGQNLTPEQWYDGLLSRIGRQLNLEDELEDFWLDHPRFSPVQRFVTALRDVALARRPGRLVTFVDEIDAVRSLPFSTDEFFAAIRECYNRRAEDPELVRLSFCLLGVATPSDLIRDTRTTPFNIGRRIELKDFSEREARALAIGLRHSAEADDSLVRDLLRRILHWTGGHPYLTQRLCRAMADEVEAAPHTETSLRSAKAIDRLCAELFLSPRARDRDDNLLFVRERILRSEADLPSLLDLYLKVRRGERVADDETNPLVSRLALSGIVRAGDYLQVRNRIYHEVFDTEWVMKNTPDAELRRQREAFRKGLLRGGALAAAVLALFAIGAVWLTPRVKHFRAVRLLDTLGGFSRNVSSYRDNGQLLRLEMELSGMEATFKGMGRLVVARPNKLHLTFKLNLGITRRDVRLISDGKQLWLYLPDFREYVLKEAPASYTDILQKEVPGDLLFGAEAIYQTFLSDHPRGLLARRARNITFDGTERVEDQPVYALSWEQPLTDPASKGIPASSRADDRKLLVKAWLNKTNGYPVQVRMDFSRLVTRAPASGPAPGINMTPQRLVLTITFNDVQLNQPSARDTFEFTPPPNARRVENIDTARLFFAVPPPSVQAPPERSLVTPQIPPRDPQAGAQQLDLTAFYNAALTETWHPSASGTAAAGNDLAALPRGLQMFGGRQFDTRGVIQLSGRQLEAVGGVFPAEVKGIKVGQRCRAIHFLHGTGWRVENGTPVALFVVRYADGRLQAIPILYGRDVRDWWAQADETVDSPGPVVAWTGANAATAAAGRALRIYQTTWPNPFPDVEVASLDFFSTMSESAPFVIAITVE
ncbi:MAG: AAA-like domain-containing protein [Verrucomicrobia bacterium]|nr:AAA-like domain-containing protein [Verrucomicrobiota bacterium]